MFRNSTAVSVMVVTVALSMVLLTASPVFGQSNSKVSLGEEISAIVEEQKNSLKSNVENQAFRNKIQSGDENEVSDAVKQRVGELRKRLDELEKETASSGSVGINSAVDARSVSESAEETLAKLRDMGFSSDKQEVSQLEKVKKKAESIADRGRVAKVQATGDGDSGSDEAASSGDIPVVVKDQVEKEETPEKREDVEENSQDSVGERGDRSEKSTERNETGVKEWSKNGTPDGNLSAETDGPPKRVKEYLRNHGVEEIPDEKPKNASQWFEKHGINRSEMREKFGPPKGRFGNASSPDIQHDFPEDIPEKVKERIRKKSRNMSGEGSFSIEVEGSRNGSMWGEEPPEKFMENGSFSPPENFSPPEGRAGEFEPPEGMEPPENYTPPEGMEPPENYTPPEGMEPP
ncbi:MAG: hypothetical protein ABEK59_12910, partial [Halobacteria archaeon]